LTKKKFGACHLAGARPESKLERPHVYPSN
jgi:hypothetical protein